MISIPNIFKITAFLLVSLLSLSVTAQDQPYKERQVEIIRFFDHQWLGVQVSDVSADLINVEKLPRKEGAYVNEVIKDSPADSAGIRSGDVILRFGDREIYDADGLVRAVRRSEANEPIRIVVVRDGRQRDLTVTLRERPRRQAVRIPRPPDTPRIMMAHRHGRLGVSVIDLNPQLGEYFKVPDGKGVLVEKVHENTPAEKAGIRAGDIIVKLDDKEIATARELRRTLSSYEAGEEVRIEIIREGARRTITAQLEEHEFSEFYLPDFDQEEFEVRIFGPGGVEEFRRNIEESIRPGLEDFKIQMEQFKDKMKDFKIEIPEHFRDISRTRRV